MCIIHMCSIQLYMWDTRSRRPPVAALLSIGYVIEKYRAVSREPRQVVVKHHVTLHIYNHRLATPFVNGHTNIII